jgi:hypothetical protein
MKSFFELLGYVEWLILKAFWFNKKNLWFLAGWKINFATRQEPKKNLSGFGRTDFLLGFSDRRF